MGAPVCERMERVLNAESTAAEMQALYQHPEEDEGVPAPLAMLQKVSA
ncbi:hypothetical protein ASR47_103039 [Janthinobacterium psychrotolerans]|uniref:Uncharacterized protein n=1 Tax=Janthinobacterium psychrotolerans TaxID=1747903 RepID=A0A1A7C9G6_9BURK|nr:hypothetical protein ASR47_103039 [Janthinobacterium psychrotolerans]